MVHALEEIHRTLKQDALVLDLRPYLPFGPLEVVHGDQANVIGRLDEAEFDPGDPAADDALGEAFRRGLFKLEAADSFHYSAYWDTVEDLREYLKEWSDTTRLPRRLANDARRGLKAHEPGARLRLRSYMVVNQMRRGS